MVSPCEPIWPGSVFADRDPWIVEQGTSRVVDESALEAECWCFVGKGEAVMIVRAGVELFEAFDPVTR